MMHLALDTATPACSVALWRDGHVTQQITLEARQHTQVLLPMVQDLLKEQQAEGRQLRSIFCSIGPGAFTGLRVGAAVAMALAQGWNCPLRPISSLALLAATAEQRFGTRRFLTVLDARMGELYAAVYERGQCLAAETLLRPEALPALYREVDLAVGLGTELLDESLPREALYPEAQAAFALQESASWQEATAALSLNYLRNQVVQS